ncbi:MAG: C-terminal binding protein [Pseudomonadota bacterium]
MTHILIPDAQFAGPPDLERRRLAPFGRVRLYRVQQGDSVPERAWRRAGAVIAYRDIRLTRREIGLLDSCRIVVRAGVGVDNIDVEALSARRIPVCNVPDYGISELADHALALMLALARGVVAYAEALRADPVAGWRWQAAPTARRLKGITFGVVGLGRTGTAAALRAKAFGMAVAFYDPLAPAGQDLALGIERVERLRDLLSVADVLSLHAPLLPATRRMIDRRAVEAMKPGALLINIARGDLVDLDAVYEGLKAGRIGGAGLDVLPVEPPDAAHPLIRAWLDDEAWLRGRLILTPHAAFYSKDSLADMRAKALDTLVAFLGEGRLVNCINQAAFAAAIAVVAKRQSTPRS